MDDPEHARLRRMPTKDFTVKRINAMRPQIEEMANDFIDSMLARGQPADLVQDYALHPPIPFGPDAGRPACGSAERRLCRCSMS